jgi:hypothetical protein
VHQQIEATSQAQVSKKTDLMQKVSCFASMAVCASSNDVWSYAQRAMEIAWAPGKNLFMTGMMLWMSGSEVNIFSMMMTGMALKTPVAGLLGIENGTPSPRPPCHASPPPWVPAPTAAAAAAANPPARSLRARGCVRRAPPPVPHIQSRTNGRTATRAQPSPR